MTRLRQRLSSPGSEIRQMATRNVARLFALALSVGCSASDVERWNSEFHEVGSFSSPNMHSMYPGITHFVVAPESVMSDRDGVLAYARRMCADGDDQVCFVFFWTDESKAARRFPMTDTQGDAMVASYNRNRSTGNDGLRCYDFGSLEERCAIR